MATKARALISIASALLLLACSDSTGPANALAGTYALSTVNGFTLPVTYEEGDLSFTVNSSTLAITPSNRFTHTISITVSSGQDSFTVAGACGGTVARSGNSVSLVTVASNVGGFECEAETAAATWDGANTLTLTLDGDLLVFKK